MLLVKNPLIGVTSVGNVGRAAAYTVVLYYILYYIIMLFLKSSLNLLFLKSS